MKKVKQIKLVLDDGTLVKFKNKYVFKRVLKEFFGQKVLIGEKQCNS